MCVEGNIISLEFNQIKMYLDSPMNVSKKHNQIRNNGFQFDMNQIWIGTQMQTVYSPEANYGSPCSKKNPCKSIHNAERQTTGELLVEFIHGILQAGNISTDYFSCLFPILKEVECWLQQKKVKKHL